MRLKPLVLAIASLQPPSRQPLVEAAEIKSLYNPRTRPVPGHVERIPPRFSVEVVAIEGQLFPLAPALHIKEGIVRRTIHTPEYTHVFSVKADFNTGNVVGHLQSFEHSTHEYVYMKGEWAITTTNTRLNGSVRHV